MVDFRDLYNFENHGADVEIKAGEYRSILQNGDTLEVLGI
jgi:hypothetical protein